MRQLLKSLAFALLDRRRTRGYHLMNDLRYWLKATPPEGVIFDVGANTGDYALEFRQSLNRDVYAFEPVQQTFAQLETATRADSRIKRFRCAMGATPGTAEIAVNPSTSLVSSIRPNSKWHANADRETVAVFTVDDVVHEQNVKRVSVLKIDVEGYEIEVLTGAANALRRGSVDFLVLETAFLSEVDEYPVPIDRLVSHLLPLGYEPWGVYDFGLLQGDRGGIGYMNVVFGRGRQR